jgi:protein-S-isoprenylcysteine O-methyltransferase Ste14
LSIAADRGPGVRFPPPLLFALALAAGWLAERWRPLQLLPAAWRGVELVAGWTLVGSWAAVSGWAVLTFVAKRTTIYPNRPARQLVTGGPYRFSRNPMYVSLFALDVGVSLVIGSLWPVLFLPAVALALDRLVVRREEWHLAELFGSRYEAYRGRVRRWL